MATTRKSSRSNAAAAANPQPEQPTSVSEEPVIDSTHQASEPSHVKDDQKLEAADSGLSTTESAPTEQPSEAAEAVTTKMQEPESTSVQEHQNEQKEPEAATPSEEPINSIHLIGHIKGLPGQALDKDATQKELLEKHLKVMSEDNSLTSAPTHQPTETVPPVEGIETTKHPKRPVENDSNTIEEQDYSNGAYKSPFRHSEKIDKEEEPWIESPEQQKVSKTVTETAQNVSDALSGNTASSQVQSQNQDQQQQAQAQGQDRGSSRTALPSL
ncbi:hypothetical protein BGX27_003574 [Mortierella sp. AM989]|nr:hypothetical protein BGX27_003574 [Mortierella sp. AM989]